MIPLTLTFTSYFVFITDQYFDETVDALTNLLKKRLLGITDTKQKADKWTNNWCQFSFGSLMRSNYDAIKTHAAGL